MISIFFIVGFAASLWVLYLAYCTLNVSRRSGKFAMTPWPVRALSYAILAVAVVGDVVFNITIGTLSFLELPSMKRITFTKRCAFHMRDVGWRGAIARWVCSSWLNPFEENHCKQQE